MPKKGENIYKRKDGRYEARYVKERDNNKILKYGYIYGKTYKEAKIKKDLALENIKTIREKEYFVGCKAFSDEIEKWLNNKLDIKESTYYNYYSIIFSSIIPFFEKTKLKDIDKQLVSGFTSYLQAKRLNSKRIKDILIVLKQFLDYMHINIKIDYPKIQKNSIVSLKNNEIAIIEKNTLNSTDIKEFCIFLVLYTGLRIGELCALQWKDVDFKSQTIYVSKTITRIKSNTSDTRTKVVIDTPKTKTSIRIVPIHNKLLPYLKKFKQDDNKYIVSGSENFLPTNKYYHYYKNFLKRVNIKKYNFHILRHTFATRSLINGMDVKTLSEILGHSSVKITLDRYVHINNSEKLKQVNRLPFYNEKKTVKS